MLFKNQKTCLFIGFMLVLNIHLFAQQNMVDMFTGDFMYDIPVMFVPSPDGPGIPLAIKYHSGIQVHQKAGWVGLGWNFDVGEIRRDVNGAPDDWKNVLQKTRLYKKSGSTWVLDKEYVSKMYGPIYFKDFGNYDAANPEREMDTYTSTASASTFTFPNYDGYVVTVPGISGNIRPFLFEKKTLVSREMNPNPSSNPMYMDSPGRERSFAATTESFSSINTIENIGACQVFTKSPQFLYENEFGTVNADAATGTFSGNLTSGGKAKCSKNIEYYTGLQYRTGTSGTLLGLIKYNGFTAVAAQDEDVVAFKITDEAGYTYHFCLPVYVSAHKAYNIVMPDFNPVNATDVTATTKVGTGIGKPYVSTWKLTAITGPDFVDNAPLNSIGAEDIGYWVAFDYGKWSSSFAWQTPYFDAMRHFGENEEWERQLREKYPRTADLWLQRDFPDFSDEGNLSKGTSELYYLDKIRTRTHTAFFVKDIRLDEYSKTGAPTTGATPNLRLDRIILLNNADAGIWGTNALSNPRPANFTMPPSNVVNLAQYTSASSLIDAKTISSTIFNYDYSQAPSYYNHVDASGTYNVTNTGFSFPAGFTDDNFTYERFTQNTTNVAATGKLTLKSITSAGIGNGVVAPKYEFTYSYENTATPRNYKHHPFKKDFWGYYMDWPSATPATHYAEYQKVANKDQVDAWSLTRIRTPLGAFIDINYESDEYGQTGRDGYPVRIFGGTYNPIGGSNTSGSFVFDDPGLFDLLNNTADIEKVSFSYPMNCTTSASYSDVIGNNFSYILGGNEGAMSASYSAANIGGVVKNVSATTTTIGSMGAPIILTPNCGAGPGGVATTASNFKHTAAIAAVQLKKAYGGGVRVKSIALKELNTATGTTLANYKTVYTYTEGVASLEPDRFTTPYVNGRPKVNYVYDPHSYAPRVGYSKVILQSQKLNLDAPDNPTQNNDLSSEYEFYNFNDYPLANRGLSTYVHDQKTLSSVHSFSNFMNQCFVGNTYSPSEPGCITATQALQSGYQSKFELWSLTQQGGLAAKDRSETLAGKIKKSVVKDKNGQTMQSAENEFERKEALSEVFHQRFHTVVPVFYDPNYLYNGSSYVVANLIKNGVKIADFSPFGSPNAAGYGTVLHSNMYFRKAMEAEYLKKQVTTQNDIRTVTEMVEFDPVTGGVTKSRLQDPATGAVIENQKEYAYTLPAYAGMGLKVENNTNTNQLALVSLEKTLKDNVLIAGVRRTFKTSLKTRKLVGASYATVTETKPWKPDKLYVFNGNSDPNQWKEETEFTLFNPRGVVLEQRSAGTSTTSGGAIDRYASMKMGYDDRFVIAETADARYTESAFSGAEDLSGTFFGSEVAKGNGTPDATFVHTGDLALKVNANNSGFTYQVTGADLTPGRAYVARVWVYKDENTNAGLRYQVITGGTTVISQDIVTSGTNGFNVNGTGYVYPNPNTGSWMLLTLRIAPGTIAAGDVLKIECVNNHASFPAYFDDFRFHPMNSSMKSYVYNQATGLMTHVLDANNYFQKIEYNAVGQPVKVWLETTSGLKLVTEGDMNYYRISTPTATY